MSLYENAVPESSCAWQGVLSPERQRNIFNQLEPLWEQVRQIEEKIVTIKSHDGQTSFDLTQKQLSLFPPYARKCMTGKMTMKKKKNGAVSYSRAWCGTWRCLCCRPYVAKRDFARTASALRKCDPENLSFFVLTLDQQECRDTIKGFNAQKSYDVMTERSRRFMRLLRKEYGKIGWVGSIEAHKSGYCHMNIVANNKEIAEEIRRSLIWSRKPHEIEVFCEIADKAGLGRIGVELVRSADRIGSYVVKVAFEGKIAKEATKETQLPIAAKKGTRRLRSSVGFLPKKEKRKKEEGVEYEFMSGVVAHELTEAAEAWERFQKDFPSEQTDKKQEAAVERVAPAKLPDRVNEEAADVQSSSSPCLTMYKWTVTEASRSFAKRYWGVDLQEEPKARVPIGGKRLELIQQGSMMLVAA